MKKIKKLDFTKLTLAEKSMYELYLKEASYNESRINALKKSIEILKVFEDFIGVNSLKSELRTYNKHLKQNLSVIDSIESKMR